MTFKDLLKFIELEHKRLKDSFSIEDNEKRILARTVKLQEEMGELCEEILKNLSLQRKEKLKSKGKLNEEFADVLITLLLLAKAVDVDVEDALEKKIRKIKKRNKSQKMRLRVY